MSFEDIARKMQEEANKKPRMEIVDQTLDLGMTLTAKDFIEPIKNIKKLKKILAKVDSMNLYKKGWRFQLGTSKEWAGLCSASPSSVYESKKNKNNQSSLSSSHSLIRSIVKGLDKLQVFEFVIVKKRE